MSGASGFEQVQRSIWDDPPFSLLSADGKVLYWWTFTNASITSSGIYRTQEGMMLLHTRLTPARLAGAWEEVAGHRMAFFFDGYVWCRARVKNLRGVNARWALSIVREITRLPAGHPLRKAFVEEYRDHDDLHRATTRDGEMLWSTVIRETDDADPLERYSDGSPMASSGGADPNRDGESAMGSETHRRPIAMGHMYLLSSSPRSRSSGTTASARGAVGRARDSTPDEQAVFEHYLDAFYPERRGSPPKLETHRDHVAAALKVATVDECKLAIDGMAANPWWRENGRTEIRRALRGKDRRETDRERIESMMQAAETHRRGDASAADLYAGTSPYDTFEPNQEGG
jgi:hypothetical protein